MEILGADISVLVPILGGLAAVFAAVYPALNEHYKNKKQKYDERQRIRATVNLLQAQFGQIARHTATNLKRLTETFRAPRNGREMVVILRKMSLAASSSSTSGTQISQTPVRVDDVSLFPEHLARDVLRLSLTARNIEIDISDAIEIFSAKPDSLFDRLEHAPETRRMESLSSTMERCSLDCAELVRKLQEFEEAQFPTSWASKFAQRLGNTRAFRDDPIHFTDAMSLREVADWAHWKEEQKLLPAEAIAAFVRSSLSLDLEKPVEVISQRFGTINSISECRVGSESYCVRIRVNENIFQYEPGLVKEVFVARVLALPTDEHEAKDVEIATIYQDTVAKPFDGNTIRFDIGPDVYFAANRCEIPRHRYPGIISDWYETALLAEADNPSDGYAALGEAVRKLHKVRTEKYYRNFRELGDYRFLRDFSDDIISEIVRRNSDIGLISLEDLESATNRAAEALAGNRSFCLCHNDLHPYNVFWRSEHSKRIVIVDWDNACINHPFLDFVKIRYWSKRSDDGRLTGNEELFRKFCEGYGVDVKDVSRSPIFLSLCLLWLLRIFMFEKKREAEGKGIPKPFQHSAYYERHIRKCVSQLNNSQ